MSTINNTTASDNSSDSASNNKKSTKSEIEVIDQKIIKCFNEINYLKQKIQREWSKQMNTHLKNFYPDDINTEQPNDSSNKSNLNNDSLNNTTNTNNSFSTPQQQNNESNEYEKKICLLNKKLRSYEKRRQKLLYDSKKEQDLSNLTNHPESVDNGSKNDSKNGSLNNGLNSLGVNNNSTSSNLVTNQLQQEKSNTAQSQGATIQITPTSTNLLGNSTQFNTMSTSSNLNSKQYRNGSFILNNSNLVSNKSSTNTDEGTSQIKTSSTGNDATSFYLNPDTIGSNVKFNENNDSITNDEFNSNQVGLNNKPYQALDRNIFYMQVERELYYLKLQQEKMQSDIEDMQKKIQENHQVLIKELQNSTNQLSENFNKISFNFYKSCDSKLDELKTSFDRSIQGFSYNLTHCHRDVKETKEDVTYMKNKIEIIDKSPKVHNIETNPTNYYQLFYKLLDIILTLATIILLAFTNLIASIKFIFLLYPRTIVILLFMYFIFFYIVDYDKLDFYFDRFLFNDLTNSNKFEDLLMNEKSNGNSTNGYLHKIIQYLYSVVFKYKARASTTS